MCLAACDGNNDCASGCCAVLENEDKVCGPASACAGCSVAGTSCTTGATCCQSGNYGASCVNFGANGNECAANCLHTSDCEGANSCCVQLTGQSYGACVVNAPAGTTCL